MPIEDKLEKNNKSVAFKAGAKEGDDQLKGDVDENLIESILFLAKSFKKIVIRLDKR